MENRPGTPFWPLEDDYIEEIMSEVNTNNSYGRPWWLQEIEKLGQESLVHDDSSDSDHTVITCESPNEMKMFATVNQPARPGTPHPLHHRVGPLDMYDPSIECHEEVCVASNQGIFENPEERLTKENTTKHSDENLTTKPDGKPTKKSNNGYKIYQKKTVLNLKRSKNHGVSKSHRLVDFRDKSRNKYHTQPPRPVVQKERLSSGTQDFHSHGLLVTTYWRYLAMNMVSSKSLFIFEVSLKRGFLVNFKISIGDMECAADTLPWSIMEGKCRWKCPEILNSTSGNRMEFSPSHLIRFILKNYDDTPAILSSSFWMLYKTRLWKQLVYDRIIPGPQTCCFGYCKKPATTVLVRSESKLFCSHHAISIGIESHVLLYNPLLIAFTKHQYMTVISAFNLDCVYGQKMFPSTPNWTPLAKIDQSIRQATPLEPGANSHSMTVSGLKTFLLVNNGHLCDMKTGDLKYEPYSDLFLV